MSQASPVSKTKRSFFLPTLSLPPKMISFDPTAHMPCAALGVGHPVNEGDSFSHVQFSNNKII